MDATKRSKVGRFQDPQHLGQSAMVTFDDIEKNGLNHSHTGRARHRGGQQNASSEGSSDFHSVFDVLINEPSSNLDVSNCHGHRLAIQRRGRASAQKERLRGKFPRLHKIDIIVYRFMSLSPN
ncbi:hypothetical protein TNCV_557381 [Trichonephila clavipes]|uniref:Uncharacterized protein n=1 Tax=Trichonephila clavipes TaxID=2585209 RepID=A0A8X6V7F3_TRICX|nr:hypothetical protein TNCV_557381 [Trichonephila clavipes]